MKTQLLLFILASVIGLSARAADCEFASRASLGPAISEMPASIIGWVNCSARAKGTNVFLVARPTALTEASLLQTVTDAAKKIDFTAESSAVTWQSKQPLEERQLMLRTVSSSGGEKLAMIHYAFASHGYVFIHSMDEAETLKIKKQLTDVNFSVRRMASGTLK